MNFEYDPEADAAYVSVDPITATDARRLATTRQVHGSVLLDLDQDGGLIGVEILGSDRPR